MTDLLWVLVLSGLGLALVLAAAHWSRDLPLFSLLPPGGSTPDVQPAQQQDLHRTFYTIWVSLILATPALATLPAAARSATAFRLWRITWTASWVVFAVHFYWAVVVLFGNDWQRILNTPRVSAPRLDTVFAVWWTVDVLLAWCHAGRAPWLRWQRAGVHGLAFVLFFMGAAREGELPLSRLLGWGLAAGTAAGLAWQAATLWRQRVRRRD
ncbi:hypothetical protein PSQ40_02645 [Curvibacter sp. HBC61]|uniref:Uncharacterized protein n=1 Tax=Curvibacter cyanobacteriorum TaxID=3026422 RepID=A0ABT5MTU5_9BURK|nr:hypothetical protein [Curvibacter sp. HBC61]MDD0837462.1 hypothetical protein [Curvibacter sp. HBC61]